MTPKPRIIIVNDQDKIIGHKIRGTLDKEDIYRVSALWVTNSKGDILLAQRKFTKSHDPGKWGPAVAGTLDEGETYESNIIKEAQEEIGLESIKPATGPKIRERGQYNYFNQWYTLTIDKPAEDFAIQENEVEQVKWFTPSELKQELREHPEDYLEGLSWCLEHLSPIKTTLVDPTTLLLNDVADEVVPAEVGSPFIQNTIDRMLQMAAGKGHSSKDSRQMVGLAAPQIGLSKRIVIIDLTADGSNKKQHMQVIINPAIVYFSKTTVPGREGCWSCRNICGIVERAKEVIVEGLDREGKPVKLKLSGFVARIAQHETDHLKGIRFPDRIPIDKPQHLHWVEPTEFDDYRKNWMHWKKLCPRKTWEAMKQTNKDGKAVAS